MISERDPRAALEGADQVEQAEAPDHPHRFPDDAPVHLRLAREPVDEEDWNLADREALSPRLERDLDLEGVAIRAHPLPVDRLEDAAPVALESARQVLHAHPGDDAAVDVRRVGEDQPREGPD